MTTTTSIVTSSSGSHLILPLDLCIRTKSVGDKSHN